MLGEAKGVRKLCVVSLLLAICCAHGTTVKTGKERLRELVVIPTVGLTASYNTKGSRAELLEDYLVPREIERLQKEIKEHPDDPERLLQLGLLVDRGDETNKGTAYYEQAEKAARKQSVIRPQDGVNLTYLGEALENLGKDAQAESVYRKATLVSSNDWRCWVGLGNFLGSHAMTILLPTNCLKLADSSFVSIVSSIGSYQAAAVDLARAKMMRKESAECFDRAVSLAPKEADAYLGRANVQFGFGMSEFLDRYYRDRQPLDADQFFQIFHPVASIRDFKEAARLCPDDYRVVAMAAYYEELLRIGEAAKRHPDEKPSINILPDDTQDSLRKAMSRLETLGQSPDKEHASGALEMLGFIKAMIFDFTGAKEVLRRAVAIEPAREKAWELLLCVAEGSDAPSEESVSICQSLVKCKSSARNHLLLAKALIKQNKPGEADNQLKQASELEPDSALPHLIAAASEIKRSADERNLSVAVDQMTLANELIAKMPDSENKQDLARACLLNWVILNAVSDRPADAKEFLKQFLGRYPDDQTAKDIMSAIE